MAKMTPHRAQEMLASIPDYPPCTCITCKDMCMRPCWPTPEEAERLLDLGYASKLMLDYWSEDKKLPYTELLCPAEPGREGGNASLFPDHGCVFFVDGLCALHDSGLKPSEGRKAGCKAKGSAHLAIAGTWNTDKGRAVVERWQAMVGT